MNRFFYSILILCGITVICHMVMSYVIWTQKFRQIWLSRFYLKSADFFLVQRENNTLTNEAQLLIIIFVLSACLVS